MHRLSAQHLALFLQLLSQISGATKVDSRAERNDCYNTIHWCIETVIVFRQHKHITKRFAKLEQR